MSQEPLPTVASLAAIMAKKDDWRAVCPKCRKHLEGTLAQLQQHRCDGDS